MIEIGKQYRIDGGKHDGTHVRLYHVDRTFAFGYLIIPGCDTVGVWSANNGVPLEQLRDRGCLIEVKPKITRTYWLAWMKNQSGAVAINNPAAATKGAWPDALAITGPHEITFTEGEGLA